MRFVHTADRHLGRLFHGVHLTEDQAHILDQCTYWISSLPSSRMRGQTPYSLPVTSMIVRCPRQAASLPRSWPTCPGTEARD